MSGEVNRGPTARKGLSVTGVISDYTIRRIQDAIVGTSPQIPSVIRERNWLE
jgi:hypothetical protein